MSNKTRVVKVTDSIGLSISHCLDADQNSQRKFPKYIQFSMVFLYAYIMHNIVFQPALYVIAGNISLVPLCLYIYISFMNKFRIREQFQFFLFCLPAKFSIALKVHDRVQTLQLSCMHTRQYM